MKIAIVHNHPIHYKHLLFTEMKTQGLDFEVLFLAAQSNVRFEPIPLSSELYAHRICSEGPYESTPTSLRFKWTWSSLQDIRPDILIISGFHAAECWSAWLWARIHRTPTTLWYESNEFDYRRLWFREIFKKLFLLGCYGAHVYGKSNKAYLVKLGMPSENITVKRAVVDVARFKSSDHDKQRTDGVTRFIYVGRLAPEKNLPVLLKAMARASITLSAKARLLIAGTGPDEKMLLEMANNLGISHLVQFVGYVPQQELPELYKKSDIFVLPSSREPWGLVALEAMLCRLPVIVSTKCGCCIDVVSSETGWSFEAEDHIRLSEILYECSSLDADTVRTMGEAAHALAEVYTPKNSARLVAESIRGIGASHNNSRANAVS